MNGITAGRYVYDAFGNVDITDTEYQFSFRFTGQKLDPETGLYYYKARYYDPALGRFLQVDPIGYEDQQNLYAYVYNDPANNTDPTGRCGPLSGACLGAAIGVVVEFVRPSRDYETWQGRLGGVVIAGARGAIAGQAASGLLLGAYGLGQGAAAGAVGGVIGTAINCYGGGGSNCGDKIALGAATGLVGGALGGAAKALQSFQVSAMIGNMAAYAETAFGAIIDQSNAAEPESGERYGVTVTQNDDGTYTISDPIPCSSVPCSGESLRDQGYYRDDDGDIRREN